MLQEELKEVKIKAELEKKEALDSLNTLQMDLDHEAIPKCAVCNRRTATMDALQGHMDVYHHDQTSKTNYGEESMEHSAQVGYLPKTRDNVVSVQCKKCD